MTNMFGHISNQLLLFFNIYCIYYYSYYVSPCGLFPFFFLFKVTDLKYLK